MPLAPEYEAMLAELAAAEGPAISDLSPAEGREMYRLMRPVNPDIAVGKIENTSIPGPAGSIPVRIYTPQGAGPFPVFVNFHGGGWVIGDLDTADAVCRGICRDSGCVVVSVDYRLAPRAPVSGRRGGCLCCHRLGGRQHERAAGERPSRRGRRKLRR